MKAGGTVWSRGECDVLVTGERTVALGTDVVVDVVALAARLRALVGEYQLPTTDYIVSSICNRRASKVAINSKIST